MENTTMKKLTCVSLSALALCVAACEEKPATPSSTQTPPAGGSNTAKPANSGSMIEAAKEKAAEAVPAAAQFTNEMRDKAVSAFQEKYDDFKMQIATLQDKAAQVPDVAKAAFAGAITQLTSLTKDVEAKLVELKSATGDTAQQLHSAIEGLWPKIQQQLDAAQKALTGG